MQQFEKYLEKRDWHNLEKFRDFDKLMTECNNWIPNEKNKLGKLPKRYELEKYMEDNPCGPHVAP